MSAHRMRAAAAGLAAAALRVARRWAVRRLLRLLADDVAEIRRRSYDDGVATGRELQAAIQSGQAPFPPAGFGQVFPRAGVEVRPRQGPTPSPRPRPSSVGTSGSIAPLRSTTPRLPAPGPIPGKDRA